MNEPEQDPAVSVEHQSAVGAVADSDEASPLVEDVLVEEVSIDGMCGVY